MSAPTRTPSLGLLGMLPIDAVRGGMAGGRAGWSAVGVGGSPSESLSDDSTEKCKKLVYPIKKFGLENFCLAQFFFGSGSKFLMDWL